jgi:hypothetical protein
MASTYSTLKIQLMATGENNTTWGNVTNTNLGTALEEAIVGSADVTFASANVTLTLTDTNASQTARNLRLRCTGTTGGATRNLVVPSIEKPYIVQNDCADSILVKTAAGTGVTVPAGKTMWVYTDGTNVVNATTHLSSLTLNAPLAVEQGGTGANTASGARTALGLGTMSTQNANAVTITGGSITGITDLAIADGGTGASTAGDARTNLGATILGGNLFTIANPSAITFPRFNANNTISALDAVAFRSAIGAGTSSTNGTVISVSGSGTVNGLSLTGTVTTSGSLTLSGTLSGVSLTSAVTGVLPVGNGGTGATTQDGARTALGATTLGGRLFTIANPGAVTFPRFNADNTVSTLSAADFRTAIGAGTSSTTGTVVSVSGSGTVNGISLSGTVTSSGTLTLAGALTGVSLTTQVSGTLPVGNGGTGATNAADARSALGAAASGANADITSLNPAGGLVVGSPTGGAQGAGTINATNLFVNGVAVGSGGAGGTVTSVNASSSVSGLSFSGGPITSSGTLNLSGTVGISSGGTGATTQNGARTALGATTVGNALFTLASPNSIRFFRVNADNTVTLQDAPDFRVSIDAPSSTGGNASGTWGINITGNAGTVTNGVVTTGSYANPSWITSLAGSKVTGVITATSPNTSVAALNIETATGAAPYIQITDAFGSCAVVGSAGDIILRAGGVNTAANVLYVDGSTKNVGIGAVSPTQKLVVAGVISSISAPGISGGFRFPDGTTQTTAATVTSVGGTGTVNGLTLTGTVTSSGNLTLGGTLSGVSLTSQVSGTLPIANGGTNATTAGQALTNLGAYPASNPNGYTSNAGTVISVSGTGTASGLTLSGTVTSSGNLTLSGTVNSLAAGTYGISISGNAATATSATSATSATTATTATTANALNTGNTYTAVGYVSTATSGTALQVGDSSGIRNFGVGSTIFIDVAGGSASAGSLVLRNTNSFTTMATFGGSGTQLTSLGVGTGPSGTAGEIRATNNVTAFFSSDARFKENIAGIEGALGVVQHIGGKTFDWTDDYIASHGGDDGYFVRKSDFGVIAQDVQQVFPLAVREREDGSLAVDYEKLVAVAFAAIVELREEVETLRAQAVKIVR